MLCISRRDQEAICLPDLGITIKLSLGRGRAPRLVLDLPDEVVVVREEILTKEQRVELDRVRAIPGSR